VEIIAEIIVQIVLWILQLLGELLLQVFGELIAGLVGRRAKESFRRLQPFRPWLVAIGYGICGAVAGAISLWLLPSLFISALWLRIVNLIVTPLLAGLLMERLGAWREMKNMATIRLDTFAYGFVFALAMALVRFTWGH
jgi:hypothetical protein